MEKYFHMNVLEMLRRHAIEPKKVSSTKGGEFSSPCPGCGGKDRFRVWPEQHNGEGAYWCRQCGCGGDAIQFLRDFEGLTFRQACERIGRVLPDSKDLSMKQKGPGLQKWNPRETVDPNLAWKTKAKSLVFWAVEQLTADQAQMRWLADRGITEDMVVQFWLGWVPADIYRSRKSWGLSSIKNEETGKDRPLWLPQGLVIPWIEGSDVVKLRIRRLDPIKGGPRYYMVPGSASVTTLIRPDVGAQLVRREVYVIVESELDAIMIYGQAGDLCGAVALGSNSSHPDIEAARILAGSAVILNALDFDAAGSSQRDWWNQHFPQSKRWPAPAGKDPGDAYKAGVNIREWISAGLPEGMRHA